MLKKVLYSIVIAIVIFLSIALFLPRYVHVERQIPIQRPAATVFTVLNDYNSFLAWSPWTGRDPTANVRISDPRVPTLYYARATPIGDVMEHLAARTPSPRVGIVGLGAGTLLAYAREGWSVHVIELDEAVVRIAGDPRLFTFVHDTKATVTTTLGDGRRELEHLPGGSFELLVRFIGFQEARMAFTLNAGQTQTLDVGPSLV